jgi:hypothetical protein
MAAYLAVAGFEVAGWVHAAKTGSDTELLCTRQPLELHKTQIEFQR